MKAYKKVMLAAAMAFSIVGTAHAGPILIAGTDSDDHGSLSAGANINGWKFIQQGIADIGANVTNTKQQAVCLGCNGSSTSGALGAFNSGFNLSGLAGTWTSVILTSVSDITNFFNGTGATSVATAGFIYMPTVVGNVGGGIDDTQLAVVNANGTAINSFLSAGGGLFTQEQASSTIGYGWLTSLLPGLNVVKSGIFDDNTLQLTAQGQAQFPGLTNSDFSNATPWHAYFTGNFGALQSLVVGNGDNIPVGAFNDTVVLGGGFAGGGGVIVPPGNNVPEPGSIALIGLGLVALLTTRRRRMEG